MYQIHRDRLPNGLRLLVVEQQHLQSATLSLFIKVGSRFETRETNGISHFLEHMVFRGTESHPSAYALNLAAEQLGGTLYAATQADHTTYRLTVPSERAEEALAVLAEMLTTPRFHELALEKKIVREEILADLDEHGAEIDPDNLSRQLIFGAEHPLSFKITGDASCLERFDEHHLRAHMERHYRARNMVLCATGNVRVEQVRAMAHGLLGGIAPGQPTLVSQPPPPRHARRFAYVENQGSQTDMRICLRSFGEDDPDALALEMMARVLDDGMSTRLHRRLCDDSGLAYEAYAALDPYEDIGLFEVGVSVEHEKTPQVISETLSMLDDFRQSPVSESELTKARARYHWELRDLLDDPEEMGDQCGVEALFGRDACPRELAARVDRIDAAELQRVARRLLRAENLHVVCVGLLDEATRAEARRRVEAFH